MSPLISIIIPTCNSELSIFAALESVLNQTFKDFEVLIIDCLSTDETLKIVQSFNDPRISLISENDNGIYDAMNKGGKLSVGKWLYFMGSDDTLYDENVLNNVCAFLLTTASEVIYGNVLINGDCGWAKDKEIYDGEFDMNKLFRKNICHQAIFYHTEVFKHAGGFNTSYKICADYDFNLKTASKFSFKYIDLTIAKFNAGGISTNVGDDGFFIDMKENILKYFHRKLLTSYMNIFFPQMIKYGNEQIKSGHFFRGLRFILSGYYHRISLKFHD